MGDRACRSSGIGCMRVVELISSVYFRAEHRLAVRSRVFSSDADIYDDILVYRVSAEVFDISGPYDGLLRGFAAIV